MGNIEWQNIVLGKAGRKRWLGIRPTVRGTVMIIMALDHVRDFFHRAAMFSSPTDLAVTTPLLFFTRWITHICAPVFMLTAGVGAYLYWIRGGRTKKELSWFLVTRGLWLILQGGPTPRMEDNVALVIYPSGQLVESRDDDPAQRFFEELAGEPPSQTPVRDLTDALEKGAKDPRVALAVLKLDQMWGAGFAQIQELAAAVKAVQVKIDTEEWAATGQPLPEPGAAASQDLARARAFRTRIELRQIGVRDEAGRIGGVGTCGRELCCATWLRQFEPITLKMAKDQGLSPSPSKISGACGRLKCCLRYELDFYKESAREFPKIGSRLTLEDGVRYAWSIPPVRNLLILLGVAAGLGFQYMVLLPVYAREILKTGPESYGLMVSAFGLGSLLSAIVMTRPQDRWGLRRNLLVGLACGGVGMGVFAWSRTLPLTLGMGFLAGFGLILYVASTNTLLQLTTEDRFRGRIMSLYTLMFIGTAPIGALLLGWIAQHRGAPVATTCSGLMLLAGAVWVSYRLRVLAAREAAEAALPAMTENLGR